MTGQGNPHRRLVLWGTGGHGKVVLDICRSQGSFDSVIFIDDRSRQLGPSFCLCQLLGGEEALASLGGCSYVVSIGNNAQRARCYGIAISRGLAPATLIHPSAVISASASIGPGTVVMAGAIVNAGAVIGENCIINSGAVIEHDCDIGDHVHISPRAALAGGVRVGSLAHVGIGAIVLPLATVGEEAVVGAGSVVLRAVPTRCTVVGVPAKALKCGARSHDD